MSILIVARGVQGQRGLTGVAAPETIIVAANIESVIAVAEDLGNIQIVIDNLDAILDAPNQAAAAEASALAAAAAAQSSLWRDVVFITFADSPKVITSADNGKLFSVDSTGGAVAITLPTINPLTMPFNLGVKKTSSDINNITVSRSGSDLIDGQTTKVISTPSAGVTFIADKDPTPDAWSTAEFGAAAGNMTTERFNGDGVTTVFNLLVAPGSGNNVWIDIDGASQHKDQYAVAGTQITFTSAPPIGTGNIEATYGTTIAVGVPSDGTVTAAKLANLSVATAAIQADAVTYAKMQNVSAASRLLGRGSAGGAGDTQELTLDATLALTGTALGVNAGAVIQRVAATPYTTCAVLAAGIPVDDTPPLIGEGDQILTANITPASTSNKVLVLAKGSSSRQTAAGSIMVALFRGSTCIDVCNVYSDGPVSQGAWSFAFEDSPASVASQTYSIRVGGTTGVTCNGFANTNTRVGGGVQACTMQLLEIKA